MTSQFSIGEPHFRASGPQESSESDPFGSLILRIIGDCRRNAAARAIRRPFSDCNRSCGAQAKAIVKHWLA